MNRLDKEEIKRRIERVIKRYTDASSREAYNLLPDSLMSGKLYEAHVLSLVIERLHRDEGLRIVLVNDNFVRLKSAPSGINPTYPHFQLFRDSARFADLWTDVEFLSLSHSWNGGSSAPSKGDYHELDLLVVEPGVTGRPTYRQVLMGVECKNTGYEKNLLKEILGIRRELSLLQDKRPTRFVSWPQTEVPAEPPSCLLVYSTDAGIADYSAPGAVFGIRFLHEPL